MSASVPAEADTPAVLAWTRTERLGLADQLDDLTDDEWRADSLCAGWTVHVVVAHLTLATYVRPWSAVAGMVRARGDLHRMLDLLSRERAARFSPAELVAQLRATAGSDRRPPGTTPLDPLVDVLVHAQDVVRPLGRPRAVPTGPGLVALEHVRRHRAHGPVDRLDGVRLVATDADWAVGTGPEVRGTVGDLLLVATGRLSAP